MAAIELMTRSDIKQLAVVGKDLEILDWVLYDNLPVLSAGAATSYRFFQHAFGNAGVTKEITNMEIPSQLPAGHRFVMQKIVLGVKEDVPASDMSVVSVKEIYKLLARGRSAFSIGSRNYLEVMNTALTGGSLTGFAGGPTEIAYAAPRTVINGELEYSPVIPSTFGFAVLVEYDIAPVVTTNKMLNCCLVGKLVRPRQG